MTIAVDDEVGIEVETRPEIFSLADLLQRLGDISPSRVRMRPAPGTATIADVERNKLCELIDGTLVEKAMGFKESILAFALGALLRDHVLQRNLGLLLGPDGTMEILTGLVRLPDVAYLSWENLPGRRVPEKDVPAVVPTLAVEVISKGNSRKEMARKREEYFAAGVRLVWMIDRFKLTATVYTAVDQFHTLTIADTLDGGDVLPGFTLKLSDLFGELDRTG